MNVPESQADLRRADIVHATVPAAHTFADRFLGIAVPLLIVLLTAAAFWPAMSGGFLNWDDDKLLQENPRFQGLGAEQLKWMFTTKLLGHYQPVTWLSYAFDHTVWKLDPFGYRLTNLLWFIAGALVFYRLAIRLLSACAVNRTVRGGADLTAAAGLAALFYAVHPLRVETVCWITNRAYVLSGLFFLLSVASYLRCVDRRSAGAGGAGFLVGSLVCFVLSLFSRANAVTLPLVLLLLDAYPLRRLPYSPRQWLRSEYRGVLLEKAPFFVLSLIGAVVAHWAKAVIGTVGSVEAFPLAARAAMAAYAMTFYWVKTVWPAGLLPLYEKPPRVNPFEAAYLLRSLFVVLVTVVLFALRRRWRAGWVLWLFYLIILLPVIGIVQIGVQIAADRYTQLACLGWALLFGVGYLSCWPRPGERGGRARLLASTVLSVVIVTGLIIGSRSQSRVWLDSETLWRTTLAGNADSLTALNNLGMMLAKSGRHKEALEHWQHALELQPKFGDIHLNVGTMFLEQGQTDKAIDRLEQALQHGVQAPLLFSNLGVAWAQKGELDRAVEYMDRAVQMDPFDARAHYNIGIVYFQQNRLDDAQRAFLEALRLKPDYPDAAHNLEVLRRHRAEQSSP